eukprot:11141308-Alexandrium_andersonii.AAC.1
MLDRCDNASDETELIQRAQTLWREWFGAARAQPAMPRIDAGRPRPRGRTLKTAWLAKRRRTVAAAAAKAACSTDGGGDAGSAWGDTHTAEL